MLPRPLLAQHHRGKHLITGVLRDSTHDHIMGSILIGDSLYWAQQEIYRQMYALHRTEMSDDPTQLAALPAAWAQWQERAMRLVRLRQDSAYQVHAALKTGRFRLWARPSDTLYITAPHHLPQRYRVADLPRKGHNLTLVLRAEPCVPYVACRDTAGPEYAFIGHRISLETSPEPYYCNEPLRIIMDSRFRARYQLLQQLQGRYAHDTMTFTVYDHYGWPAFRRYPHVLLFVKSYCGQLIHQKYQYYPVYRTVDGRWAAPYNWLDHRVAELEPPIKPHPIAFAAPVRVTLSGADSAAMAERYPAPYYRLENGQAVAVYGNYVEELVENRQRLAGPRRALNRRLEAQFREVSPKP